MHDHLAARVCFLCLLTFIATAPLLGQGKSHRLPSVDLKQPIIWGSACEGPDGTGLAFGGLDQHAEDGAATTRIKRDGQWLAISGELRQGSLTHKLGEATHRHRAALRNAAAATRHAWFQGQPNSEAVLKQLRAGLEQAKLEIKSIADQIRAKPLAAIDGPQGDLLVRAFDALARAGAAIDALKPDASGPISADTLRRLAAIDRALLDAADLLGAEPPSRALSPIAYDTQTGMYVLFGGDHLDYLTNDTWLFDPKKQLWTRRLQDTLPAPRANHTLRANGDGTITLSGGYTYTSNTDYCGGQYRDLGDGEWVYDIAKNTWTARDPKGKAGDPFSRTYRTGPFHPDFFLEGPPPDREAVAKMLADLPVNTWVSMDPPKLPQLNRDWGTAVIDPDHDLILRFSGGHSAHGGSDVLHYHFATNRWELTFPVEFPLGQLYTNTEYPQGFNFNKRPWVSGHTYKSYAYDTESKRMLFTGHTKHTYLYDPTIGDWVGRAVKPKGMDYNDCFYDLVLTPTPRGLLCWTKSGRLFQHDPKTHGWTELTLTGDKMRGAVVDRSSIAYDNKRDRLIAIGKTSYGGKYDGLIYTIDLKTLAVKEIKPPGAATMIALDFLRESIYEPDADLIVLGTTLPADTADGPRPTAAFDCAADRWVALTLGGKDIHGKSGRDVSLGLMYDAKRRLMWAVDTHSRVSVLRFDRAKAQVKPLAD